MNILEITRSKVHIPNITDETLQFSIDEVEQVIKNYCVIDEIPSGLYYTWANMTRDLVLYEYHSNPTNASTNTEINMDDVTTVKVGDTQISIGDGGKTTDKGKAKASHKLNIDGITMNYRQQLNQFRRLGW